MEGTTPSEMAVILVEVDGTVYDFLAANFGVTRGGGGGGGDDFVKVGDYVDAKGEYQAEPHRLVAEKLKVKDCDEDGDGDDKHGCRENDCWGRLEGPVTDVSSEERYLEIMGTKVYFYDKHDEDFDDYDIGDWVHVDATSDEDVNDGKVEACRRPHGHHGHDAKVKGFVQEVVRGDDDEIIGVIVLNTLIEVNEDCEIDD